MADTTTPGLVLYDIAFAPPFSKNTAAPNPWKARYALNFKAVPYKTQWVQMPDITKVRRNLGVAPGRKFADGTDFYTLPILTDSTTGAALGDTFDIATYLQTHYPNTGTGDLFPDQQLDYVCPVTIDLDVPLSEQNNALHTEYAKFNTNVDTAFTLHSLLTAHGMHWDPALKDEINAEFARRVGAKSWDELKLEGEKREQTLLSLRDTLRDLAAMFQRDASGPFLLGRQPSYADIIVGGWLRMLSVTLPGEEWEQVRTWYDGVFGQLHAALQERFGDVK